ncbi:hypothetical protein M3J09_012529 [Ascochyta lentis]
MSDRSRLGGIHSLTFGAPSNTFANPTKKRPLTPAASSNTPKRSKSGPFIIDSSSDGDGDSDVDDSNDGFDHSGHISVTTRRLERSDSYRVGKLDDEDDTIRSPRASFEQQAPSTAPERQLFTPKAALTPHSGKILNKDRLRMMLAKKQTSTAAQVPTRQKAPMSVGRAGTDPRSRSLNDRNISEEQPALTAAQGITRKIATPSALNGITRENAYAPAFTSLQRTQLTQFAQDTKPNPLSRSTQRPLNEATETSQASRAFTQQLPSFQGTNLPPHVQQAPSSRQPNSSTPRTANNARLHSSANNSSLRNILDTAKAGHTAAAVENEGIGIQWQKAKAGRVSMQSARKVKKPEVGARYGHTLTAGKTRDAERGVVGVREAPTTPVNSKSTHIPVSRSQASLEEASPVSPKTQVQAFEPRSAQASRISPVDRIFADNQGRSAPNTKQNLVADSVSRSAQSGTPRDGIHTAVSLTAKEPNSFHGNSSSRGSATSSSKDQTLRNVAKGSQNARVSYTQSSSKLVDQTAANAARRKQDTSTSKLHANTVSASGAELPEPPSQKLPAIPVQPSPVSANVEPVNQKHVPAVHSERSHGSQSTLATAAKDQGQIPDETMGWAYDTSTVSSSGALEPRVSNAIFRTSNEIPVAVMVRPAPEADARPLSTGGTRNTVSEAAEVLETFKSQTASSSGMSEPQLSIKMSDAQSGISTARAVNLQHTNVMNATGKAVSSAHEPMGRSEDGQGSPKVGAVTQTSLPTHVADVFSEDQRSETLEPVASYPTEPISRIRAEPTLPVASSKDPQSASTPSRKRTPASIKETAQLIASATLLSPRPATSSSSPQALPDPNASSNPQLTPVVSAVPTHPTRSHASTSTAVITLPSPTISSTAEPYFEYSIHQTLSSPGSDNTTTEISAHPFLSAEAANARTARLMHNAQHQYKYLNMQCNSTATTLTEHGLLACECTFTNMLDPSATLSLKIWVSRNVVGVHGSPSPSHLQHPPLLSRNIYALRLWRLIETKSNTDTDSESNSDSDSNTTNETPNNNQRLRTHHPLPPITTDLHTTLPSANRAAKRVQIALSHEETATQPLQKKWQAQNQRALNQKLEDLEREISDGEQERLGVDRQDEERDNPPSLFEFEAGRRRGCWRSVFHGAGLGADTFELLVVRVGVSGPRNL